AVDCGAIPDTLIESELFGYEKGAFTGAHQRKEGHFRLAEGGSLFLDEIANLPLPTQAKLLRVLQERQVQPLGSKQPVRVDVRLAADVIESEQRPFLPVDASPATGVGGEPVPAGSSLKQIGDAAAADAERQAISRVLQATRGNKSEAARHLRTDYKTLHLKMK